MPEQAIPTAKHSRLQGLTEEALRRGLWEDIRWREPEVLAEFGLNDLTSFVEYAAVHDPHEGRKPFTRWLVHTYAVGGFLLEDFAKATEVLRSFRRWQRKLALADRDLNTHATLAAVSALVLPLEAAERESGLTASGREADRREALAVRDETHFLVEREDGFVVVIPLTERAAKWWGRGTKWCTAADKDNRFTEYYQTSPLVVMRWPDGRKVQAWLSPDGISQLMDEADRYPGAFLVERWDEARPLAMTLGRVNEVCMQALQDDQKDAEVCFVAVKWRGVSLRYVPLHQRDTQTCLAAVLERGVALQYVPYFLRTREMCMAAVATYGVALREVPEDLRDPEICLAAVLNHPSALTHVPEKWQTREIFLASVEAHGISLSLVPTHLRDVGICLAAVRQDGAALSYVPEEFRHREMYLEALTVQGHYYSEKVINDRWGNSWSIPKEIGDKTFFMEAIKKNPRTWMRVPTELRDREILMAALAQDGSLLREISKETLDYEMCLTAVKANWGSLAYVPVAILDREIYMAALGNFEQVTPHRPHYMNIILGSPLQEIPIDLRDEAMCLFAVRVDARALVDVPDEVMSADIAKAAKFPNGIPRGLSPHVLQILKAKMSSETREALRAADEARMQGFEASLAKWREVFQDFA